MAKTTSDQGLNRTIGRNLMLLRKSTGLTQGDLSGLLGVSYQQVQKYESGKDRLPVEAMLRLRTVFAVSLDSFLAAVPDWSPGGGADMGEMPADALARHLVRRVHGVRDVTTRMRIARVVDLLCDA